MNFLSFFKSLKPKDIPVLLEPAQNGIINYLRSVAEAENKKEIVIFGYVNEDKLNFVLSSIKEEKIDNEIVQRIEKFYPIEIGGIKHTVLNFDNFAQNILTKENLKNIFK